MSNSVHSSDMLKNEGTRRWLFDVSKPRKKKDTHFFFQNCINWVVSAKAKGEIITDPRFGCTCISSSKKKREYNSERIIIYFCRFGDFRLYINRMY